MLDVAVFNDSVCILFDVIEKKLSVVCDPNEFI